ncbi:bacterio-opsin activator [Sulfurihydrogenibium sp.]|uniref:bacterio-opsin activator n=1 Tax=Sulfurihydrogenibium sp. TaxID=2053621 RepID=UPI00260E69A7|nr:bacterio-opsin activator [Sulfurihydrogenibium sp.]
MVVEITGIPENQQDVEHLVSRVFFKSIDLLGGLSKLAEYRTLTWLPSLARASYVIVLRDEYLKTEEEIAEKVGLTKNTVRNILRADPTLALEKIKKLEELAKEELKEMKVHTAGGIAKLAYKMVKEGQDAETLVHYCQIVSEEVAKILDIPWAYMVLKHTKGIKYPINDSIELIEKLKDLKIKGHDAAEILNKIQYPVKTPAMLLHEIKQVLSSKEEGMYSI